MNYFSKILLIFLLFFSINQIIGQSTRPIRDSIGYTWSGEKFINLIKYLDEQNKNEKEFPTENLIAAISPHDDYLYAANVYYPLYKLIKAKEVVVFGVTHSSVRKAFDNPKNILFLDEYDLWQGPFGKVKISELREKIKNELPKNYYKISNKAQNLEHSIEGLIPFLQYYNKDLKITPIMITEMNLDKMNEISKKLTEVITNYINEKNYKLGEDIFFLISNDANHYGSDFNNSPFGEDKNAHKIGTTNDKKIANKTFNGILSNDKIKNLTKEIWESENNNAPLWCGRYPIVFGLTTINKIVKKQKLGKVKGKLFKYSDTITDGILPVKETGLRITGISNYKHWVGYFSAGFYLEK